MRRVGLLASTGGERRGVDHVRFGHLRWGSRASRMGFVVS
jgi:hypothetical protein